MQDTARYKYLNKGPAKGVQDPCLAGKAPAKTAKPTSGGPSLVTSTSCLAHILWNVHIDLLHKFREAGDQTGPCHKAAADFFGTGYFLPRNPAFMCRRQA